eukprot:2170098-Prymnesium_polylepis.1
MPRSDCSSADSSRSSSETMSCSISASSRLDTCDTGGTQVGHRLDTGWTPATALQRRWAAA